MSEIDQQFIEYVVKSLVGKPDAVSIERRIDEKGVLLELTVDPEDLGRVIGKRGATAQSLRTLLRALGTKNDARYNLKIIDNGPMDARPQRNDDTASSSASDDSKKPEPVASTDDSSDADVAVTDEPEEAKPEPSPEPANEESVEDEEEKTSDRLAKARSELADLDDLDI